MKVKIIMSKENKSKTVMMFLARNVLIAEVNVRIALTGIIDLNASILNKGLEKFLLVWQRGSEYVILQGHRRLAAINMLPEEAYLGIFPKGIPCNVISNISLAEALRLKVDHGTEVSLTHPVEVQLCANLLFAAGETEAYVATDLATMIDRIAPMKDKNRKEYEAITDPKLAAEYYAKYRRGYVQTLHNIARLPHQAMAAYFLHAAGHLPEGAPEVEYPVGGVSQGQAVSLWNAHSEDLKILGTDGLPVHSQIRPGPAFLARWEAIIASNKKSAEDKANGVKVPPKAKAMSAEKLLEELKSGKWYSKLSKTHVKRASGSEVASIQELDADCYKAELVKENNPDLWKQVEASSAAISKKLAEADAAAASKAAAAVTETTNPMAATVVVTEEEK